MCCLVLSCPVLSSLIGTVSLQLKSVIKLVKMHEFCLVLMKVLLDISLSHYFMLVQIT